MSVVASSGQMEGKTQPNCVEGMGAFRKTDLSVVWEREVGPIKDKRAGGGKMSSPSIHLSVILSRYCEPLGICVLYHVSAAGARKITRPFFHRRENACFCWLKFVKEQPALALGLGTLKALWLLTLGVGPPKPVRLL